jgi:small conductance mechanosensitive channel
MSKYAETCAFVAAVWALLFVYLPTSHAQEQGARVDLQQEESSELRELVDAAAALTDRLQQLKAELAGLKAAYADAKGEEKEIYRTQLRSKREALIRVLEQLINNNEEQNAAGQTAMQEADLERELVGAISALGTSIEQTQRYVARLREQRSSASQEEREALDGEIEGRASEVDDDLGTYFGLTLLAQAHGADTSQLWKFLDGKLRERAEGLSGILQFFNQERESIDNVAPGGSDEDKKAQVAKSSAIEERIDEAAAHLYATVAIMKDRGMDTAPYTQLLIQSTGELTEDIFQTDVILGLLRSALENAKDWMIENGTRWLFKFIVFVLILAAFKLLAGIVKRLVSRAVTTSTLDISQLMRSQIVFFAGKVVMFVGILVALSQLGFQLGPVLAGLGIAGFIVGFALQDTLSNFAAGMMILIYRPYDVGDAVEAGGVMGTVKAMNLVSTSITTWDNQKLVVPNSKIWGDVIRNITAEPNRRVDMTFRISYADDIEHTERVLWEILKGNELVLTDPEPVIKLHALGESSVDFVVRPWSRTSDYWTVYWDITRKVKKRFDEEGISIPFPQRDVHLVQGKGTA